LGLAARKSFKTDVSFLEKISIGAVGTRRVFEDLKGQGHSPIELERGSQSFKIWKNIKIKRIRVPDILCVSCGLRVESRAKTNMVIAMSHSTSDPERGWDYGLDDGDYVGLVAVKRGGERPVDWTPGKLVQYVLVRQLRAAEKLGSTITSTPKGAQEGFEARITWPSAIAGAGGVISSVTNDRIQYQRDQDKKIITVRLQRGKHSLSPLVKESTHVEENQILASVVNVALNVPCNRTASEDYYIRKLSGPALSERYGSAKALSHFRSHEVMKSLSSRVENPKEHIYVRLEAAASLSRLGDDTGTKFIQECIQDQYLQNRLEAVIVLGEIRTPKASEILKRTLMDKNQHPEIRAGAAWALGEIQERTALGSLIDSFRTVDEVLRVEAARALAKLARRYGSDVVKQFAIVDEETRPGIAWALSKAGTFTLDELLDTRVDNDAKQWVAYIIGTQGRDRFVSDIEKLQTTDPEVYFAATVLWKIITSWISNLEEYG
jgi:HEAT repeat protein